MSPNLYGRPAKRSLGQNFLRDPNTARKIVGLLDLAPGDRVIEIGPGAGALTQFIEQAGPSTAVLLEKDPHWAGELKARWPGLAVALADALDFPWERTALRAPWKVCGNLPYNVASPIIWEFAARAAGCPLAAFMIQKEVAQRLAAPPGNRTYGALSVWVQSFARVRQAFVVKPTVFRPRPKVDSAVVVLARIPTPQVDFSPAALNALLRRCFQNRRKQLSKILKDVWSDALEAFLAEQGLAPSARPEVLAPNQFQALSNLTQNRFRP
jgi:16S rRNA (adenine1518-N6/adenine1519-N6)-dimethyltransferase